MGEASIFVDESGGQGGHSRYYVLTLVFHDQANDIEDDLEKYRQGLRKRGLAEIPFHMGPLMTGHDDYEGLGLETRKGYFSQFFIFLQHLPVRYQSFVYRRSEFSGEEALSARMRRDVTNLLFDNLEYFQSFDNVKLYYDDGQEIVVRALHAAIEYVLSKNGVLYRRTRAADFALEQAADLLCTLELTARKYEEHEQTRTDEKFFGTPRSFKNNYMKIIKRKRLER